MALKQQIMLNKLIEDGYIHEVNPDGIQGCIVKSLAFILKSLKRRPGGIR